MLQCPLALFKPCIIVSKAMPWSRSGKVSQGYWIFFKFRDVCIWFQKPAHNNYKVQLNKALNFRINHLLNCLRYSNRFFYIRLNFQYRLKTWKSFLSNYLFHVCNVGKPTLAILLDVIKQKRRNFSLGYWCFCTLHHIF